MFKIKIILGLLFITFSSFSQDFEDLFQYLQKESKDELEKGLNRLSNISDVEKKKAYRGALLTKYAQFGYNPFKKLELFNQGTELIEKSIKQNPQNIEYRLIRLMIQENCPGFLNYSSKIQEDVKYIKSNLKNSDNSFKNCVAIYSKRSKHLN